MKKIALISTPWPLFNRPSIQLGTLKAFIKENIPDVQIDNYHLYLFIAHRLGYELYNAISESTWLSEPLYGALLYPEKIDSIKKFWNRYASRIINKNKKRFDDIYSLLKEESDYLLNRIPWDEYLLIGFSICFSQLTSSLYFIRSIKKIVPNTKIVIGGISCAGDMGKSLMDTYNEIDFVIQGEGEKPLFHLITSIIKSDNINPYPGLLLRDSEHIINNPICQVENLNKLPVPDFKDYFKQLEDIAKPKPFQPKLSMEISRGCWWKKCRFCNLNIQWKGYRSKSSERVVKELNLLVEKYKTLSISFMDNLLPPNKKDIFQAIIRLKKDFKLFAEIRANTKLDELLIMKEAGVDEVQVGIEALSSGLLKKMNKGTTAIQNIEIMKNCEARGTPKLIGNLIFQFPGSDEKDVRETIKNLDFVFPLRPLNGVSFWLGYGSYIWKNQDLFNIKTITNHRNYSFIFPEDLLNNLIFMIQGYQGEIKNQKKIWKPVKDKIKKWKKFYNEMHKTPDSDPILSYQDGGNFLIIRQRISQNKNIVHRLKGLSREIFLYCQHNRSVSEILGYFNGLSELKLMPFLKMMTEKKLMFCERDRYLSLAIPLKGWRHY